MLSPTDTGYWRALASLCREARALGDPSQDPEASRALTERLREMVKRLPKDDSAVIAAEAQAIYYELTGDLVKAARFRSMEIDRIRALHEEMADPRYDNETRKFALTEHGPTALAERVAILDSLRRRLKG